MSESGSEVRREKGREYRRRVYDLRETSRALSERVTVQRCGLWESFGRFRSADKGVVDFAIGVTRSGTTAAKAVGLHACGSVWECPVCHGRIVSSRAVDVTDFAREARRRGFVLRMETLTIRHAWTDRLEDTAAAVADGWRAVLQSTAVRELRAREGWHFVRALEVKHGENGWHPHLHVLIAIERPGDDAHRAAVIQRAWIPACAKLKEENRPIEGVAVVQTEIDVERADYLQKLGLEIADDRSKRSGGRLPFDLLEDARAGDLRARALWQIYARAMVGKRALTWGVGVRKTFGLAAEPTDEDLALERADAPEDKIVLSVETQVYTRAIGRIPGLLAVVLDALERHGIAEALAEIAAAHGDTGDDTVRMIIESHRWITLSRKALYERSDGAPTKPRKRFLRFK